jgi:AcrR family transcriptional regulator
MPAERKLPLKTHGDGPPARASHPTGAQINHRTRVGAERRARMRLRILEGAVQVFADKGGDLPVIDDFIRAADVSRGTFYNYFSTTAELLEATVAWLADDVIRSIDPEVAAIEEPALRLATAIRMYLRWAATDPEWCRFMAKIPSIGVIAERRISRDLRQGRRSGVFKYAKLSAAHDLIVGASQQAIRRMTEEAAWPALSDEVIGMVLRGLGVSDTRIEDILRAPLPLQHRPVKSLSLLHRGAKPLVGSAAQPRASAAPKTNGSSEKAASTRRRSK